MKYKEYKRKLRRDPACLYHSVIFWLECQYCKIFKHKWQIKINEWYDGSLTRDKLCTRCGTYEGGL